MHVKFDDVYRSCVIGRRNRDFTQAEKEQGKYLRACHKIYKIYAFYGLLHEFKDTSEAAGLDSSELLRLYNKRLSKKRTHPRKYYDELIRRSPNRKCLLCHIGEASTLDHFLPKENYPSLSISYNNLIPACDYCNRTKSKYLSLSKECQLIHPLFDHFYNRNWLKAVYSEVDNMIYFQVNYEKNTIEYKRVLFHVKKFGILDTFSAKAMSLVLSLVRNAIYKKLSLYEMIEINRDLLIMRYKDYPKSRYTIDLWQWLTLDALLSSQTFLTSGKQIFGGARMIEISSTTYE
ncbi:HNH endonuclease [Cronobacter turicensis]|uniref:HNH endonuclease n=1 Tax=Cronobacter turicensis TaxID=413502 RepID=UPI0014130F2D|nr:HNH endonuclease [Cronobacter turicensis]NHV10347.1 HNH endonuclease [Cronobacter turicensis]NHV64120.1 HNH endonuclease [Cronobacter turicensis]NHW10530.1 HNH endonuclease [Cronobacter turicensis]